MRCRGVSSSRDCWFRVYTVGNVVIVLVDTVPAAPPSPLPLLPLWLYAPPTITRPHARLSSFCLVPGRMRISASKGGRYIFFVLWQTNLTLPSMPSPTPLPPLPVATHASDQHYHTRMSAIRLSLLRISLDAPIFFTKYFRV